MGEAGTCIVNRNGARHDFHRFGDSVHRAEFSGKDLASGVLANGSRSFDDKLQSLRGVVVAEEDVGPPVRLTVST